MIKVTAKDYGIIARVIKTAYENSQDKAEFKKELIERLKYYLAADNPRFDNDKFKQAINYVVSSECDKS